MPSSEINPPSLQRIVVSLEYDGTDFSGWQRQRAPVQSTIQQHLEQALSQIADQPISTICAGRTDAGVHATCQVVHFDTSIDRGSQAWLKGTNSLLPDSISVLWSKAVEQNFHARFSAFARRYYYVILQQEIAPAILANYVTHIREPLNHEAMHEAAQLLLGENDFSCFRAAGCQSKSPCRNVTQANVFKQGVFVILDIKANAFLQHMVRNIVGSLLDIGRGEQEPIWITQLLTGKDRCKAGRTAPPHGLYLVEVNYPAEIGLPPSFAIPSFLDPG